MESERPLGSFYRSDGGLPRLQEAFRSDKLEEDLWVHFCEATKGNKFNIPGGEACKHCGKKRTSVPLAARAS